MGYQGSIDNKVSDTADTMRIAQGGDRRAEVTMSSCSTLHGVLVGLGCKIWAILWFLVLAGLAEYLGTMPGVPNQ